MKGAQSLTSLEKERKEENYAHKLTQQGTKQTQNNAGHVKETKKNINKKIKETLSQAN